MLSASAEYALRALVHLAREGRDGSVRADDLARATQVPRNYLGKILHELTRAGVLQSTRGRQGGFRLAVPPEQLSLIQVVSRFDDIGSRRRCLMGRPECSDLEPCSVHHRWKQVAEQIARFFRDTTLADLLG